MKLRGYWQLACALLLLCSACGDDDQGTVDPAVTGGTRDAGDEASPDDEGDPPDDDDSPGTAGRGGAGGATAGADSGMNEGMRAWGASAGTGPRGRAAQPGGLDWPAPS